jgi:anhydro-N-acetylmuramic acid kinase
LAPLFHRAWFGRPGEALALLNIGGMANLTLLRPDGGCIGFDCGPGNVLMDGWCARHRGQAFDAGGAWAASGQVLPGLLARLLGEPFFQRLPPKSTGRDLFDMNWLASHLAQEGLESLSGLAAAATPHASLAGATRSEGVGEAHLADVQATLAELTARTCADDLCRHGREVGRLVVCGGGALNDHLMARLSACLPGVQVTGSSELGLPPLQVEAAAFAWLAWQTVMGKAQALQSITGAKGARVLGCIYPA